MTTSTPSTINVAEIARKQKACSLLLTASQEIQETLQQISSSSSSDIPLPGDTAEKLLDKLTNIHTSTKQLYQPLLPILNAWDEIYATNDKSFLDPDALEIQKLQQDHRRMFRLYEKGEADLRHLKKIPNENPIYSTPKFSEQLQKDLEKLQQLIKQHETKKPVLLHQLYRAKAYLSFSERELKLEILNKLDELAKIKEKLEAVKKDFPTLTVQEARDFMPTVSSPAASSSSPASIPPTSSAATTPTSSSSTVTATTTTAASTVSSLAAQSPARSIELVRQRFQGNKIPSYYSGSNAETTTNPNKSLSSIRTEGVNWGTTNTTTSTSSSSSTSTISNATSSPATSTSTSTTTPQSTSAPTATSSTTTATTSTVSTPTSTPASPALPAPIIVTTAQSVTSSSTSSTLISSPIATPIKPATPSIPTTPSSSTAIASTSSSTTASSSTLAASSVVSTPSTPNVAALTAKFTNLKTTALAPQSPLAAHSLLATRPAASSPSTPNTATKDPILTGLREKTLKPEYEKYSG
ncbi:MAG: hypothetical protein WCW01_05190 [Gammaproteobacteria bacterium]